MAKDISGLNNKIENGGEAPRGVLTPKDWNTLVDAVIENQNEVTKSIKGIILNGATYTSPDSNGLLKIDIKDSDYTVEIHVEQAPPSIITKGDPCVVKFTIINRDKNGIPSILPATARFYWGSELVGTITDIYDVDFNDAGVLNPLKNVEFDFSKATQLSTSAEGNVLKVELDNNLGGNGSTVAQPFRTSVIDVKLEATLSGGVSNKYIFTEENTPKLTTVFSGGDGYLYVNIDGDTVINGELLSKDETRELTNIFNSYNTHGIHTLSVYATPVSHTNIKVAIDDIEYIYGDSNDDSPLIITNITDNQEFEVYGDINLNYTAYWANPTSDNIVITVKRGNSNIFTPINIENVKFSKNIYDGSYSISIFPEDGASVDSLVGEADINITLGDFTNTTKVSIKKTTDIVLRALGGWDVELLARDSQASNDTKKWECTNKKGETYRAIFSDNVEFSANGSGFNWVEETDKRDSTKKVKYQAMSLKKGRFFTLDYQPFKENPTWSGYIGSATNGTGKTISFEFAVRNCLNLDTEVISCIDENGVGFKITANEIFLGSDSKNTNLSCNFKEGERIRVDIAIDGKLEHYKYDTVKGTGGKPFPGESDEALMIIYINGVYQRLALIPQGTSFKQADPKYITFGSNECDLDVYNIRIYNSTVYMDNIVKNYAADTPDTKEAISLMIRNDIFGESTTHRPSIDLGKLINTARPDLPIMYFTMDPSYEDVLPKDKENWLTLSKTRWYNPNSTDKTSDGNVSWETKYGVFRNQGTSSMNYPWPWRNWDFKLDKYKDESGEKQSGYFEVPLLGGEKLKKWFQYPNMPGGLTKITLKKDYASSEMCNNAICSEIFTDMALGIANKYNSKETGDVLSPMMRDNGGANTNYRLTFKATPCFAIQLLNDGKNTQSAMGMMNLIPNKNEVVYLGMDKSPYTWAESRTQSWECAENHVNWDTPYFTTWADSDPRTPEQGGPKDGDSGYGYYGNVEEKVLDENGKPVLDDEGNFTYQTVYKYIGNYLNGLNANYEARYPKDSENGWDDVDFGYAYKGDLNSEADFQALVNEQSDILDLHNWFVLTNRYCATDKELSTLYKEEPYYGLLGDYKIEPWNIDKATGDPKYTTDTKEYRREKFEKEAPYRLHKAQWVLYYLWREQFWMFDSGSKNLQLYTMGKCKDWPYDQNEYPAPMQWGCMVRDADTALGINNLGVDMFPPHLEDTDCYSVSGDGSIQFHYDEAANYLSAEQLPSGKYSVLNGQFGSIWMNIRDCWGDALEQMYKDLSANPNKTNFSAEKAIERFDKHQDHWSESLYNWGMRQYFGGTPFSAQIGSGNGNKRFSRKNWLEKAFYYRNSKYNNLADYVSWRGRTYKTADKIPSKFVNVKTYLPMYLATGGSTTTMDAQQWHFRVTNPNEGINIDPFANGFGLTNNDKNVYLFGSDNITDLGDLARFCKMKSEGPATSAVVIPTSGMPKLKSLKLGHHVDPNKPGHETAYTELVNDESVPLTNNLALYLELNGLPALTYLDITNHVALRNIQIYNCLQLEEFYASGTDRLSNIIFPKTTTLREVHLGAGLTKLDLNGLTGIEVFDWDKSYVSKAEENETLTKPGMQKLEVLKIVNCGDLLRGNKSYEIVKEAIDSLVESHKKGVYDTVCEISDVNWTGVDEEVLIKLLDINAEITGEIEVESLSFDTKLRLLSKYTSIDNESDKVNGLYVKYPSVNIGDITMPSNTYFDTTGPKQLKFSVANTDGNNFVSMQWSMAPANSQYAKLNEKSGILTINKIGTEAEAPYVDVTVNITLKNGSKATATGRVNFFLRSCRVGDYVFNDGSYMDTLQDGKSAIGVCFYIDPMNKDNRLMVALNDVSVNSTAWGLQNDRINGIVGVELTSDPSYNCYNIRKVTNIQGTGVIDYPALTGYTGPGMYNDSNNLVDSVYRSGSSQNDNFTEFETNTAYGDLGWQTTLFDINIEKDNISYPAKSTLPIGLYKTLAIIEHRNTILNDSSVGFPIPEASGKTTELQDLNNCITIYKEGNQHLLYYPAASACYAYEPKVDNLDDRFKKHTWWLPTTGEILRLLYYIVNNSPEFDKVRSDGKFTFKSGAKYTTSTQSDAENTFEIRPSSRAAQLQKYVALNVCRPVNKF